jgi:hypothetical protein
VRVSDPALHPAGAARSTSVARRREQKKCPAQRGLHSPSSLRARLRGHRVETFRLGLSLWPGRLLVEVKNPKSARGHARGRRGLELLSHGSARSMRRRRLPEPPFRRIASPLMQPSPIGRRIGIRIVTFEDLCGPGKLAGRGSTGLGPTRRSRRSEQQSGGSSRMRY